MVIGNGIYAKRRIKSKIYANIIIGEVTRVWDNAVEVKVNNTEWRLYFADWQIKVLI